MHRSNLSNFSNSDLRKKPSATVITPPRSKKGTTKANKSPLKPLQPSSAANLFSTSAINQGISAAQESGGEKCTLTGEQKKLLVVMSDHLIFLRNGICANNPVTPDILLYAKLYNILASFKAMEIYCEKTEFYIDKSSQNISALLNRIISSHGILIEADNRLTHFAEKILPQLANIPQVDSPLLENPLIFQKLKSACLSLYPQFRKFLKEVTIQASDVENDLFTINIYLKKIEAILTTMQGDQSVENIDQYIQLYSAEIQAIYLLVAICSELAIDFSTTNSSVQDFLNFATATARKDLANKIIEHPDPIQFLQVLLKKINAVKIDFSVFALAIKRSPVKENEVFETVAVPEDGELDKIFSAKSFVNFSLFAHEPSTPKSSDNNAEHAIIPNLKSV